MHLCNYESSKYPTIIVARICSNILESCWLDAPATALDLTCYAPQIECRERLDTFLMPLILQVFQTSVPNSI